MQDPYKVLGVSPNASDDEIKQAYRRLAKQYHPDRNPGDAAAAKKMQEINAAYEQIKNPEKGQPGNGYGGAYGSYGGYGYDPFGGSNQRTYQDPQADPYQDAAHNYIRFRRYAEALQALSNSKSRNARWYYLSALANNGLGNQVTALEHMKRAVSMEPDNAEYLRALSAMENSGAAYRRQAGTYRGFTFGGNPCLNLCLCYCLQWLCCRC